MTEIGNVVFSVEKIDQLKAEIGRLREIIRKAHLAATCQPQFGPIKRLVLLSSFRAAH
jgi:hypothetical protein